MASFTRGDWGGGSLPSLTSSNFEIICRRTSGNSSLSICKNIGRRCAIVLTEKKSQYGLLTLGFDKYEKVTHSSFPRIGASPLIWVPRAALTCCEASLTKSSTAPIISSRRVWRSSKPQKPVIRDQFVFLIWQSCERNYLEFGRQQQFVPPPLYPSTALQMQEQDHA